MSAPPAERPAHGVYAGGEEHARGEEREVMLAQDSGRRSFMGVELLVGPGALVPRRETELLATTALRLLTGPAPVLIDLCCGSANLACALACHLPGAHVFATDLTPESVAVARRNVAHLGLTQRIEVRCGDLFAPLADLLPLARGTDACDDATNDATNDAIHAATHQVTAGPIDAIVCNPPYISTGRLLGDRAGLLAREPREAFDGGPYGIAIHQRVVREAPPFLRPGGWLLFEIGLGQERQVRALFERSRRYSDIAGVADPTGAVRVVVGRRRAD